MDLIEIGNSAEILRRIIKNDARTGGTMAANIMGFRGKLSRFTEGTPYQEIVVPIASEILEVLNNRPEKETSGVSAETRSKMEGLLDSIVSRIAEPA